MDITTSPRSRGVGGVVQEKATMTDVRFPVGWDDERVRRVLEHYETQSDEEAIADDETASQGEALTPKRDDECD